MVAKSSHPKQHGASLIESLMGLVITAVVATLAASAWANQITSRRLIGYIDELIQDMHWARSEAVVRGASVRLSLVNDGAGQACYVIHTGEANACGCAASTNQACSATATALKVVKLTSSDNLSLSYTSQSLLWSSTTGTVTPAGTVKLEHPSLGAVHVVVNMMGRIRTCSPSAAVTGHPAC